MKKKCTFHDENADGRFYSAEIDADVLIYNGTIEGELTSIDELVKKTACLRIFRR